MKPSHRCTAGGTVAVALLAITAMAAETPVAIAHRGASAYAPEHTFAAWDLALEMGADYLEQDLQMTADGELVVLHDDTLDRTARGPVEVCTGPVSERLLAELDACEFGAWFDASDRGTSDRSFAGAPLPTLRAVFERYAGRARFYIETKQPEDAPGMEEALIELLEEFDLLAPSTGPPTVILQSFSPASLAKLRQFAPDAVLVQLTPGSMTASALRDRLDEVAAYANGIGPNQRRVDRALVEAAHARGLVVHPYTVNATTDMERLLDLGVDGMFSDHPDTLRRLIDSR